jgi:hypothetical protein
LALDQTLQRIDRAGGIAASGALTDAVLLCLLLFFIAAPAAGLYFFLGFPGSTIAGVVASLAIAAMVFYLARSSIDLDAAIRLEVLLFSLALSDADAPTRRAP